MKKIYISGPITNYEDTSYLRFKKAESYLISLGYSVINPMELPHNHNKSYISFLKEDSRALSYCDGIYLLKNWEKSRGSVFEFNLAVSFCLSILYEF
jgi:hypothetical protein